MMAIGERNGRHGYDQPALAVEKAPCCADLFPALALQGVELFTDQYGEAYALTSDAVGRQTLRLRSDAFRNWLIRRYLDAKIRPGLGAIRDDIAVMTAMAGLHTRELHNRSAFSEDQTTLYIDLAAASGRVVKVEAGRWQVIDDVPVRFQRLMHQEPLPEPARDGDLRKVLDLLPAFRSESDQVLVLTWTVGALVPFARPILMLVGEPGSGKTTMSRMLRRLVDPSKGDLLGQDGRADLPLTFAQHAVPTFDNVDALSKRESDLFCRAVTGGGITRRTLYTDSDEFVRRFRRAVIMSSLAPPTNRPDFLDRSLIIGLDRMVPERRQALSGLEAAFHAAWPLLFGGLLNALSDALALRSRTPQGNLSRMADFHWFGRAAAVALGWTPELFDAAIREAEARQNRGAADNTLVAAIVAFAQQQRRWVGDMPSLLERLVETARLRQLSRSRDFWPETAIGLGRKIELLRPALAEHGVSITRMRRARERLVQLEYDADAEGQGAD